MTSMTPNRIVADRLTELMEFRQTKSLDPISFGSWLDGCFSSEAANKDVVEYSATLKKVVQPCVNIKPGERSLTSALRIWG